MKAGIAIIAAVVGIMAECGYCADANTVSKTGVTEPNFTWPKHKSIDGYGVAIYQPQVESLANNVLKARAAIKVTEDSNKTTYGVVFFSGSSDIDKEQRKVNLRELKIDKITCPASPEKEQELKTKLSKLMPETFSTSLDHLEVSLAMTKAREGAKGVAVKNPVPQIFYSTKPSLLVLVDGEPVMKDYEAGVKRVMNTEPLLLYDETQSKYYLRVQYRWMEAGGLGGPWKTVREMRPEIDKALDKAIDANQTDLLKSPGGIVGDALSKGIVPAIFVSSEPAELIVTYGEPNMQKIDGTNAMWVTNTLSDVLVEGGQFYFLTSGRWFTASSLEGPWSFVNGANLPVDFKEIPANHPRGAVLVSIPGTMQAQESLIANAVPQTATIKKAEAKFKPKFDGVPQFAAIEGTNLKYAKNSPTPIIDVPGNTFYAVSDGVWFKAKDTADQWVVADSVPSEIYMIPPSSPVYYATYVQEYGSTDDEAYFGYTPGYYGTVVSEGTVVYGTGYYYEPWVGGAWYGTPITYGNGVAFGWNSNYGWTFGYDMARPLASPWWGPMAWGWNGNTVSRYEWHGYDGWGGAANANVYRRWGGATYKGGGSAVTWQNPWTGREGAARRGVVYNPATGSFAMGAKGVEYNPRTGNYAAGERGMAYNGRTGGVTTAARGTAGNVYIGGGMEGQRGVYGGRENNVFADREGQVYRNMGQGQWQRYGSQGWGGAGAMGEMANEQNIRENSYARERESMGGGFGGARQGGGFGGGRR